MKTWNTRSCRSFYKSDLFYTLWTPFLSPVPLKQANTKTKPSSSCLYSWQNSRHDSLRGQLETSKLGFCPQATKWITLLFAGYQSSSSGLYLACRIWLNLFLAAASSFSMRRIFSWASSSCAIPPTNRWLIITVVSCSSKMAAFFAAVTKLSAALLTALPAVCGEKAPVDNKNNEKPSIANSLRDWKHDLLCFPMRHRRSQSKLKINCCHQVSFAIICCATSRKADSIRSISPGAKGFLERSNTREKRKNAKKPLVPGIVIDLQRFCNTSHTVFDFRALFTTWWNHFAYKNYTYEIQGSRKESKLWCHQLLRSSHVEIATSLKPFPTSTKVKQSGAYGTHINKIIRRAFSFLSFRTI